MKMEKKKISVLLLLFVLVVVALLVSMALGQYPIPFPLPDQKDPMLETILFEIRLPRVLAAVMIGGAMALSGASYQGMFRNPMVSPDILGASAGAGFGAALAILFSCNAGEIQIMAFLFGLLAVGLTLLVSKTISRKGNMTLILVLTGMVVSTLFSSLISITKYVADPDSKLPSITFWLMGGLSSVGSRDVKLLFVLFLVGAIPLLLVRWRLNVLSFGDEEAQGMGVDVPKLRLTVILASTLLTAACVSLCGLVGWIGLVVPHMARLLVGPNFKDLLPASTFLGAFFLLIVDDVARCAFSVEIPLGILTALIGAPFFLYLLMKGKKGWT